MKLQMKSENEQPKTTQNLILLLYYYLLFYFTIYYWVFYIWSPISWIPSKNDKRNTALVKETLYIYIYQKSTYSIFIFVYRFMQMRLTLACLPPGQIWRPIRGIRRIRPTLAAFWSRFLQWLGESRDASCLGCVRAMFGKYTVIKSLKPISCKFSFNFGFIISITFDPSYYLPNTLKKQAAFLTKKFKICIIAQQNINLHKVKIYL